MYGIMFESFSSFEFFEEITQNRSNYHESINNINEKWFFVLHREHDKFILCYKRIYRFIYILWDLIESLNRLISYLLNI